MKHLTHFFGHAFTGTGLILIVTLTAIVLHYIVKLAEVTMNPLIIYGLRGAEYAFFIFDLIILSVYLLSSLKKLINELWKA